jgi:hypothetical protein
LSIEDHITYGLNITRRLHMKGREMEDGERLSLFKV